jgi:hypothetical protein
MLQNMTLLILAAVTQATEKVSSLSKTEAKTEILTLIQSDLSHLFTLDVSMGTPAQSTRMLLDLSGHTTYAFASTCTTFLTRPHKFY